MQWGVGRGRTESISVMFSDIIYTRWIITQPVQSFIIALLLALALPGGNTFPCSTLLQFKPTEIPNYKIVMTQLTLNCDHGSKFHVEFLTRIMIPRGQGSWSNVALRPGHNSMLNLWPGSWFYAEMKPRIKIHRCILFPSQRMNVDLTILPKINPGYNKTLNCDLGHNSTLDCGQGHIFQCWILTDLYTFCPLNCDPWRCQNSTAYSILNSLGEQLLKKQNREST